nr:MAG TPA: hypothetical protein [Caudoviricetes sp.]
MGLVLSVNEPISSYSPAGAYRLLAFYLSVMH